MMTALKFNKILLPDLTNYKDKLVGKGLKLPLKAIPIASNGLLNLLPKAENKFGWPWTVETSVNAYRKNIQYPKLTIVTPSYNQGLFIEQTIRSILLQNYPNLEYIVIDGGSTDNTKEILEKYSPWISYWQSEKDNGQGQAINLGFSIAAGNYYAWINSDDYYTENAFALVISNFLKSKAEFIYGYSSNYNTKSNQFETVKVHQLYDYLIRIPMLHQPACFWKAEIHQPIWEDLQCSLDYELWLRLVKDKKRKLLKKVLAIANVHDDNKTQDSKMGAAWKHDHDLICSTEAHGPVYNWNKIVILHRILTKISNWLTK